MKGVLSGSKVGVACQEIKACFPGQIGAWEATDATTKAQALPGLIFFYSGQNLNWPAEFCQIAYFEHEQDYVQFKAILVHVSDESVAQWQGICFVCRWSQVQAHYVPKRSLYEARRQTLWLRAEADQRELQGRMCPFLKQDDVNLKMTEQQYTFLSLPSNSNNRKGHSLAIKHLLLHSEDSSCNLQHIWLKNVRGIFGSKLGKGISLRP